MRKIVFYILITSAILSFKASAVMAEEAAKKPPAVNLPILMYHQISTDPSKLSRYVIGADAFESDLKLLQKNGYSAVTVKDLLEYTQNGRALPEKPVMLTFDDGYESDYIYAFPLLKKYSTKAVFSIIGKYTDLYSGGDVTKHISYSHLSWPQIKEMHDSGLAEFHNHTYDMHDTQKRRGALQQPDETIIDYENAVVKDFTILNDKYVDYVGEVPAAFTCPYGYYNSSLKDVVKKFGYSAILTSHQRVNLLTGDPEELFYLGRYVRAHNMNLQSLIDTWENDARSVEK